MKQNLKLIGVGILTVAVLSGLGWFLKYEDSNTYYDSVAAIDLVEKDSTRKQEFEKYLKSLKLSSDVSVYIQAEDEIFVWNSHRVRAASLMKPFILAKLFEEVKKGELALDQVVKIKAEDKVGGAGRLTGYPSGTALTLRQLAIAMIANNDNTATNMLINLLGMDNINKYIIDAGYKGTVLQRKMMDNDSLRLGRENYTTAEDLGVLFMKLERGECVSPEYDREMLYILMQEENRETFNTALPDKRIAHKVGEVQGLIYDGGIIYDENLENPYVLVVLNDNYRSRPEALELIWKITKKINDIIEK